MRIIVILLVAFAALMFVAGCPKGGVKILGPSGPSQPGIYFGRNWQQPIRLVDPLETKKKECEGRDFSGRREVYYITVVDIEKTFELHSEAVIHPGSGEFELYVYPGSPMYGLLGEMDAVPAAHFADYTVPTDSIKVVYMGDINLGSENDPKPVSKFSVFLTSRGRYLIDAVEGEGRILVEW